MDVNLVGFCLLAIGVFISAARAAAVRASSAGVPRWFGCTFGLLL